MVQRDTQDKGQQVEGALEINLLYWKEFFALDTSQRADAERMLQQKIISSESKGNYEVIVGRAGLHEVPLVPQINNNPAYFGERADAQSLANYLISEKKVTARVEEQLD